MIFVNKVQYATSLSIEGPAGASGVPVRLLTVVLRHWGVHAGKLSPDGAHQKCSSSQHHGPASHTAHYQGE